MDWRIPASKQNIADVIEGYLKNYFNDPVVEIQRTAPRTIRVRVGQGDRGPRYYRIQVVEEV